MVAKHPRDMHGLRRADQATACLLAELAALARPEITTAALDVHAAATIQRLGAEPVFRTQNGFPSCINTSVNDEAVHGVPGDRVLLAGDLLKIDCGLRLGGYCGDSTITIAVGPDERVSKSRRVVIEVAREAMQRGIGAVRVGGAAGDIGHAMGTFVTARGYQLLRAYTGHGLGRRLWEPPTIPSVGRPGTGARIVEGLVLTIEPIVVGPGAMVLVDADGWTVRTADGTPAAQFENAVMATRFGVEVLSQTPVA